MGLFGGNKSKKTRNRPNRVPPPPRRGGSMSVGDDLDDAVEDVMEFDYDSEDITRNSNFNGNDYSSGENNSSSSGGSFDDGGSSSDD